MQAACDVALAWRLRWVERASGEREQQPEKPGAGGALQPGGMVAYADDAHLIGKPSFLASLSALLATRSPSLLSSHSLVRSPSSFALSSLAFSTRLSAPLYSSTLPLFPFPRFPPSPLASLQARSLTPHHTTPHHATPHHTTPRHITRLYTTQLHITPHRTILVHASQHHTIPHYTSRTQPKTPLQTQMQTQA